MHAARLVAGGIASLLVAGWGIPPAAAQLPVLTEPPWLGYFAVFANKHYQFGVTNQGKITLAPSGEKDDPIRHSLAIPIEITVEEIRPDGTTSVKHLQPATLESVQPATAKLESSIIRGKVTGGASFEVALTQNRGVVSLGGRLLDRGKPGKYPLRFSLRVVFPSAYRFDKTDDKIAAKTFRKKIAADHLDLTWTDGKRKKQAFDQALDAASKDLNGSGIAAVEVDSSAYKGTKILVSATPNSALTLSNTQGALLHEGFALHWRADPAKDPAGQARLSFELK